MSISNLLNGSRSLSKAQKYAVISFIARNFSYDRFYLYRNLDKFFNGKIELVFDLPSFENEQVALCNKKGCVYLCYYTEHFYDATINEKRDAKIDLLNEDLMFLLAWV